MEVDVKKIVTISKIRGSAYIPGFVLSSICHRFPATVSIWIAETEIAPFSCLRKILLIVGAQFQKFSAGFFELCVNPCDVEKVRAWINAELKNEGAGPHPDPRCDLSPERPGEVYFRKVKL